MTHTMPRPALAPRPLALALAATALLVPAIAAADDAVDTDRARLEIEATLASLNERGLLPIGEDGSTVLRAPPQQRWELGAVLDLADTRADGPRVLAVTPDGAAARMGLRVDDRIQRINGVAIQGGPRAAGVLMGAMGRRDGQLDVDVRRGGETLSLRGTASSLAVPGYALTLDTGAAEGSDCGRIDVFPSRRASLQVWPVVLHSINGRLPGPDAQTQFKLAPGRHVLKLTEVITDVRIGNELRREMLARRDRDLREFVIDIEAGMTYRIGARFVVEKRNEIDSGGYWEPVVWRRFGQSCRGAVFAAPVAAH
jgi:hypothetical protein